MILTIFEPLSKKKVRLIIWANLEAIIINILLAPQQQKQMIPAFGAIIIVFVVCARCAIALQPQLRKNRRWANLTDYLTSDRIFRVVQYASLFISGSIQRQDRCQGCTVFSVLQNLQLKEFESLTLMMSRSRKVIRFIRAPLLLNSILNRKIPLNFSSKIETLTTIENLARLFSDLSDLVFFLTDHYGVFYWLGLTGDPAMVKTLTTLGDIMWISCSFFFFFIIASILARNYLLFKAKEQMWRQKQVKIAVMDLFCHCNEFVLGFCFLNPGMVPKELVATMALASTITRLFKLRVN